MPRRVLLTAVAVIGAAVGATVAATPASAAQSSVSQINTATLSRYDTVALIEASTSQLSSSAKSALAAFVAAAGS